MGIGEGARLDKQRTTQAPLSVQMANGITLVCAGLVLRSRAPRTTPATSVDVPDKFRTILDALDEEDRRDENWDLGAPPAKEQPTELAAGALGKQRRPRLS